MHHRASTLSASQKALSVLLSIILVVGLSPFGQMPGRAWADDGDDSAKVIKTETDGVDDVRFAPPVAYNETEPFIDTDVVKMGVEGSGKVFSVSYPAIAIPSHQYGSGSDSTGVWAGIAVPFHTLQYKQSSGDAGFYYGVGSVNDVEAAVAAVKAYNNDDGLVRGADANLDYYADGSYVRKTVTDRDYLYSSVYKNTTDSSVSAAGGFFVIVTDKSVIGMENQNTTDASKIAAVYNVDLSNVKEGLAITATESGADNGDEGDIAISTKRGNDVVAGGDKYAAIGDVVSARVTPPEGYALKSVKFNDGADATPAADGSYQYTVKNGDTGVALAVEYGKYDISPVAGTGGSVNVTPSAKSGEFVTITTAPAGTSSTASVTVVGASGIEYPVSGSGTSYTFTMPAEAVTVTATFNSSTYPDNGSTDATNTNNVASLECDEADITLYYTDIANAITDASAATNATLTMLKDQTIDKPVTAGVNGFTFDLGGKMLTFAAAASPATTVGSLTYAHGANVIKNGTVSANTVLSGKGAINVENTATLDADKASLDLSAAVTTTVGDSVYVAGAGASLKTTANFQLNQAAAETDGKAGIVAKTGAKVEVPSGTWTSSTVTGATGFVGISAADGAKVTVGDETAKTGPSIKTYQAAISATGAGTEVTVHGGTFDTESCTATSAAADATTASAYAATGAKMTIENGAFKAKHYAATAGSTGSIEINDGSFTSTTAAILRSAGSVLVFGGKFGETGKTDLYDANTTLAATNSPLLVLGGKFYAKPSATNLVDANSKYDADKATAPWDVTLDMSKANVSYASTGNYEGTAITPEPTVTWASAMEDSANASLVTKTLEMGADKDYTIKYYTDADATQGAADAVTYGTWYGKVTPVNTAVWGTSTKTQDLTVKADITKADAYLAATYDGTFVPAAQYTATWVNKDTTITPAVQFRFGANVINRDVEGVKDTNFTVSGGSANPGAATVTATVTNLHTNSVFAAGTRTIDFTIGGAAVKTLADMQFSPATAVVSPSISSNVLSGNGYNTQNLTLPVVKNTAGDTLTKGTHYDVTGTDPDGGSVPITSAGVATIGKAGEYTFTFAGKAAEGYDAAVTKTAKFTVEPLDLSTSKAQVVLGTPFVQDTTGGYSVSYSNVKSTDLTSGSVVSVKYTDSALNNGTAFTIGSAYFSVDPAQISSAGSQTIKVTGNGGVVGKSSSITANVTAEAITACTFTSKSSRSYTGKAQKVAYSTTAGDSEVTVNGVNTLTEGTDFEIVYYKKGTTTEVEPIEPGTYTVVAKGINGYTGTASATTDYVIAPKDITSSDLTFTPQYNNAKTGATAFKFTGEAYDLTKLLVVKDGDKTLEYGVDYTLSPTTLSKTGKVRVYGKGNYNPSTNKELTIDFTADALLSEAAEVSSVPTDLVFTPQNNSSQGKQLEPKFTLKNKANGEALVAGTDYAAQVKYYKASKTNDAGKPTEYSTTPLTAITDAGWYKAEFTGAGNYRGTVSDATVIGTTDANLFAEFEVAAFDLSKATIPASANIDVEELTFTGAKQAPAVNTNGASTLNVTYGSAPDQITIPLVQDTDFTTNESTDADTYDLVITGEGNYTNTLANTLKYTIGKFDLSNAKVQFENPAGSGVYTDDYVGAVGGADPSIRVIIDNGAKAPYEFDPSAYEAKFEATSGTAAKVTVTGTGEGNALKDATSEKVANYSLSANSLADYELKLSKESEEYTAAGTAVTASIAHKTSGATIAGNVAYVYYKGTDSSNPQPFTSGVTTLKDAGSYTIVGYCTAGYSGTVTAQFTIEANDISKAKITYDDGADQQVIFGETAAEDIKAYTYTGEEIKLKNLAVEDTNGQPVTDQANAKKNKSGYTIAYTANTEAGQATATLTGVGNYAGTVTIPFTIDPVKFEDQFQVYKFVDPSGVTPVKNSAKTAKATASSSVVTVNNTAAVSYTYTGSKIDPTVVVTDNLKLNLSKVANGNVVPTKELKEGTDYTLIYDNDVNASTSSASATVYIVPTSANYEGTITATYTIAKVPFDEEHVTVTAEDQEYTGNPIEAVTAKLGDKDLVAGADYIVTYENNTAVGTAKATLIGQGNFSSAAIAKEFQVKKADFGKAVVELSDDTFTYTGEAQAPTVKSVKLGGEDVAYNLGAVPASVNAGSYEIAATPADSANYEGTARASYRIVPAAQAVTASDATVYMGKSLTLSARSTGDGALTFVSKDAGVAKVDPKTGVVTPVAAGTAQVVVTAAKTANYNASAAKTVTVTVKKNANTVTAKGKTLKAKKLSAKKLKKKAQGYKAKKYVAVSGAQGKVTYKLASAKKGKKAMKAKALKKAFKVNAKTGKLTVGKGVKKGAYTLTVQVNAAGNGSYDAKAVTATAKVVVKK